jgi:hypothetical protein
VPVDYSSSDDDNGRWLGFEHRPDDIVISTRSKTGTTSVQPALMTFSEGTRALLAESSDYEADRTEEQGVQPSEEGHRDHGRRGDNVSASGPREYTS